MSVRMMADVYDNGPNDPTLIAVLLCLANSADDNGGNCFPGTALIAMRTRYSERTVIRAIAELEADDWITVVQRGSGRPKRGAKWEQAAYKSQYQLNVRRLKGCQNVTVSENSGRFKGCQGVTVLENSGSSRQRVTLMSEKGDTQTEKGDIDDKPPHPLKGVSVLDPEKHPLPPVVPQGGTCVLIPATLDAAADQVCNALSLGKRRRRMARDAIELESTKGESPPTVALAIIAAVRDQARLHAEEKLRFQFGLAAFLSDGVWKDRNRWAWDNERLRLRREASAGSYG